jgi:hypothetical protein
VIRGLTRNFANWAVSGVMWFFGDYTAVDKLTASTVEFVAGWANFHRAWPTLLTCYFPGVDTIGHLHGPAAPRYRWSIEHFDHQFGRVCNWLEREGLLATTTLILVSARGLMPCRPGGPIPLLSYVRDGWGLRATSDVHQDGPAARRQKLYEPFEAVVVAAGVRCAAIHLRGAAGWGGPPPSPADITAQVEAGAAGRRVWELPGVELVAYRIDDSTIRLRAPRGVAHIETRRNAANGRFDIRYAPAPDDILEYAADPKLRRFVEAGFHTDREWLQAARDAEFPTVVAQLPPLLLDGDRIGQVFLFAAPGYSFAAEQGGHGGIHRDEVCIPLLFAGPGLPAGTTIPFARAADLAPTILALCGAQPTAPETFDGVNILPQAGAAGPNESLNRRPVSTGSR